jgi:hypothetical protein
MEVWIFHGENGRIASGAFSSKEKAEIFIKKYNLSGVLTWYVVDEGIYDWAISSGFFEVKKAEQQGSEFIQRFTSGSQPHFHYENGQLD